MEHSSCGNMRAQFLLVTSIDRLKQDEELALSFLCAVSARLICNLDCVCVCVVFLFCPGDFFFQTKFSIVVSIA